MSFLYIYGSFGLATGAWFWGRMRRWARDGGWQGTVILMPITLAASVIWPLTAAVLLVTKK